MHELQQILLQKLPRLGELTFWCLLFDNEEDPELAKPSEVIVWYNDDSGYYYVAPLNITHNVISERWVIYEEDVYGHPFTHADILEALGEDWAMDWAYYLLQNDWAGSFEAVVLETEEWERNIILPQNLSDLSLPEYEETRKQLISLLTK